MGVYNNGAGGGGYQVTRGGRGERAAAEIPGTLVPVSLPSRAHLRQKKRGGWGGGYSLKPSSGCEAGA